MTFHNIFIRTTQHTESKCLGDAILMIFNRLDLWQKPVPIRNQMSVLSSPIRSIFLKEASESIYRLKTLCVTVRSFPFVGQYFLLISWNDKTHKKMTEFIKSLIFSKNQKPTNFIVHKHHFLNTTTFHAGEYYLEVLYFIYVCIQYFKYVDCSHKLKHDSLCAR